MKNTQPAPLPRMSTPRYQPEEGHVITITIPDEVTRAEIVKVISDDAVIAKLTTFTMQSGKSHDYRKGDLVPCKFTTLGMGQPGWQAVTQREMDEAAAAKKARKR